MHGIELAVEGLPPAKSEAISCFGATHSHADRVRTLLIAARDWLSANPGFVKLQTPLILELVVHSPENVDPWDATNYLGGVADVLEEKSRRTKNPRVKYEHLAELIHVSLYENDRQIKEIHYYQETASTARYIVRIRPRTS